MDPKPQQQDCLMKHNSVSADTNNNHVHLLEQHQQSNKTTMSNSNKLNDSIHHHPFIHHGNDHLNLNNHLNHNGMNSVIQQSRSNAKTISLQNLYNNIPTNDFVGSQMKSSTSTTMAANENTNAQLVEILKPFYNSMQILEKNPPLISSENSGALYLIDSDRKLNIVDPQNQLSILSHQTPTNESSTYVHSALSVPNFSEFLNHQKKLPDLIYHQNVNYHNDPTSSSTPTPNYFNRYSAVSANIGNDSINNSISTTTTNNNSSLTTNHNFLSKVNYMKNLEYQIAQNGSSTTTNGSTTSTTSNSSGSGKTRGRKKSKKGPFICQECGKEFCNQSTLTKHMITHSDERKFVCPQCSKAFKRHDHLNGHMLTHREHKPYACDIDGCDKSYCDARSLRRHKDKHKENALLLQTNDTNDASTSLTTHKSTTSALLNTEKGNPTNNNNIPLPINASTHLQFIALQQKKLPQPPSETNQPQNNSSEENGAISKITVDNNNNNNINKNNNNSSSFDLENDHHHNINRLITATTDHTNENALLHQLLTSQHQEKTTTHLFNSSSAATTNRQSIIHNNSTVIKANDNYVNVCDNSPDNYLQLFKNNSSDNKELNHHHHKKQIVIMRDEPNDMTKSVQDQNNDNTKSTVDSQIECSICLKKFQSLEIFAAHMRLHNEETKVNAFLFQKSLLTSEEIKKDLMQNVHLNPSSYVEFGLKNCELEMNKNYENFIAEQPTTVKQQTFDDITLFDNKTNDIEFRNVFQNVSSQQNQQQFNSSLALLATENDKHDLMASASNHLYQEQQIYENKNNPNIVDTNEPNYEVPNDLSEPQTKGLNEVMFSPITPVTPLKNNSQFTFEFSNQTDKDVEEQANKMDCLDICKNDHINYVSALENDIAGNFCEDLMQKNQIEMDHSQTDFNQTLNDNRIEEFADHNIVDKNFNAVPTHNEFFDNNKHDSAFNSFDFPSNKLTSDLFNRRVRKNADINKTKELLSIKQIAASLQSFGQNYERNHQNQHNHNNINHSYSVPTTPLVSSNQISENTESSYQVHSLSHHSLPATPIDGAHFTFKTNGAYHQQVSSMPTTPIDTNHHQQTHNTQQQQQFNFIFPPETEQNDDLINSRNFDINCLSDSNYSEFISYNSKETSSIPNEFSIENQLNFKQQNDLQQVHHYDANIPETTSSTNIVQNGQQQHQQIAVNDLNANHVGFYESTSVMNYVTTTNQTNSANEDNVNSRECKSLNSIMNTYIPPIKDFLQINDQQQTTNQSNNQNDSDHQRTLVKSSKEHQNSAHRQEQYQLENPVKDINSNYIISNEIDTKLPSKPTIITTNNNENQYPRIKSPNFIKTLTKKLSSINGTSNQLTLKRKKPRPEPLYIPPHVNTFVYHSRLRSPRLWNTSKIEPSVSPPPYTPPPMLSPVRSGSGLFWKINNKSWVPCYNSNSRFFNKKMMIVDMKETCEPDLKTPTTAYEPDDYDIPQTDIQPHVNIGPNFQARIPTFNSNRSKVKAKSDKAVLFWDPTVLNKISDETLDLYLKISCSMCVTGHGNNKEYALHLLYYCQGNVLEALGKLVDSKANFNINHPLSSYYYADRDVWTQDEINSFQKSILKYDKDFYLISKQIKTKSVKECIQFYYLWKKNSLDLVKRLRILRRKRDSVFYDYENENNNKKTNGELENGVNDGVCTVATSTTSTKTKSKTLYACDNCGKKFRNLKARSVHMKSNACNND